MSIFYFILFYVDNVDNIIKRWLVLYCGRITFNYYKTSAHFLFELNQSTFINSRTPPWPPSTATNPSNTKSMSLNISLMKLSPNPFPASTLSKPLTTPMMSKTKCSPSESDTSPSTPCSESGSQAPKPTSLLLSPAQPSPVSESVRSLKSTTAATGWTNLMKDNTCLELFNGLKSWSAPSNRPKKYLSYLLKLN